MLVDEVTVAEVVEALRVRLPGCSPTSFRVLTSTAGTRMEVIVHFLGLLELYKQGLVELEQATTFGELRVVWTGTLGHGQAEGGGEDLAGGSQDPAGGAEDGDRLARRRWLQSASVSLADLDYRG